MKILRSPLTLRSIAAWTVVGMLALSGMAAEKEVTSTRNIEGIVEEAAGAPLQGAHVVIYTGKPKEGPAYLCPYCYKDCGRTTSTDAEGRFVFEDVDASLLYRLLVVRDGYLSAFISDVDPGTDLAEASLDPLNLKGISAERILKAKVMDQNGQPVFGAQVEVEGWSTHEGRTTWGPPSRTMLTPMAVSNKEGEVTLVAKERLRSIDIQVTCPNYAQAEFYELPFRNEIHQFNLSEGGAISGKLVHDGKPLSGRQILLASEDRSTRSNFIEETIATDPNGRFLFLNMPTGLVYHVTASSESIENMGITRLTRVSDLQEGETRDIGTLQIEPGLTISGSVELSDEANIPEDSVLFLSHDRIWGGQRIKLPPDGTFEAKGMHPGEYRCTIRMPGYRLSGMNRSFNDLNGGELLATIKNSAKGLVILMEPGDRDLNGIGLPPGMPWRESARFQPLHGIEPLPREELAAEIQVKAIDAETKMPIEKFSVIPGWKFQRPEQMAWQIFQERTVKVDSPEKIQIASRNGAAHVQVKADGYFASSMNVDGKFDEVVTVELTQGKGIKGNVVLPGGEPAYKAEVLMTRSREEKVMRQRLYIRNRQFDRNTRADSHVAATDETGAFEFPPTRNVESLYFVHPSGFATVRDPSVQGLVSVQLQAWSKISGRLSGFPEDKNYYIQVMSEPPAQLLEKKGPPKLVANLFKAVDQVVQGNNRDALGPILTLGHSASWNDGGEFHIEDVPPGRWWVVLSERKSVSQHPGAFQLVPLDGEEVEVEPGETTQVDFHFEVK